VFPLESRPDASTEGQAVHPKNSAANRFASGVALQKKGRFSEALEIFRRLAREEPGNVNLQGHLGALLDRTGFLTESEQALRQAVALAPASPGPRQALALNLMAQGQYPEGWALYEARHESPGSGLPPATAFPFPQWRGEDLAGKKLVILPEQGFGDQIQFARFVPKLAAAGAEVMLFAPPELHALFAHSFPEATVILAAGSVDFPDPDYWVMSGALVGRLGVTLETLPSEPYLKTPAVAPARKEGFKIGLQTRGNPNHPNDTHRSLPSNMAAFLRSNLPGEIVGLDPAETGARDFAQTAAVMEQLDAIVTVDTSIAHLAGALGRPCFVLLPHFGTDWRWMREREDSPWYRNTQLYRRGPRDANWAPAIKRLAQDVAGLAEAG
jgi:hypothetical protein